MTWAVPNWKRVLLKAWSVRANLISGALLGLLACWDAFEGHVPLWIYASVSISGHVLSPFLRVVDQKGDCG